MESEDFEPQSHRGHREPSGKGSTLGQIRKVIVQCQPEHRKDIRCDKEREEQLDYQEASREQPDILLCQPEGACHGRRLSVSSVTLWFKTSASFPEIAAPHAKGARRMVFHKNFRQVGNPAVAPLQWRCL